jgi:hypothetical protein
MALVKITNSNIESALQLINLASEQGLTDVSSIIYRSLESPIQSNESLIKLEDSLIKLARWTKKDLFFDDRSQHFIIKGEPTSDKYEDEIYERSDIIARFELTDDDPKQIKISSDFEGITSKKNKTLKLADFINKNNEAISALNQHMKIHDELAKINPALKTHSSFKPEISSIKLSFDYLDKDPRILISYFNINDGSGAGSRQSNNNILEILPDNKFRLKHIDRELGPVEFFTEVEKIKKLSDLANFVMDKFLKDGARVTIMENPSNHLLPKISIQDGDHSYMINSESITIKAPGGSKTTEKLEDFVDKLKNPSPLVSSDGIASRVSSGELVK